MNNQAPTPAETASSSYLRRRSALQEAAAQTTINNSTAGAGIHPNQSTASRRPSAHNALQSDFSLTLTSLSEHPNQPPVLTRSTTPTISANAPLTSPFQKQRVADENQAVASMVASNDIQRPASAPPRGSRSRHTSRKLDDVGAEMMEAAQLDMSPPLQNVRSKSSIKDTALDTMQLFTSNLSDRSLALLFLFIVMWGAVLSLDRLTTYSYQTIATNSFSSHSSLALVNVVRAVVAAVAAIPFAVIADLCGRYQAFTIALFFYTIGHVVMSASISVPSFTGGVILYEIGANGLVCLQSTVLADMTSSRNRLFFQMMPQMPFLVFSFVSSDIYSAILPRWRWGVGLFAILGPVSLFPVVWILHNSQKGLKGPAVSSTQSLRRASIQHNSSTILHTLRCVKHVWELADLFGLFLLASSLTLILIPLTLAASSPDTWENPRIVSMIGVGVVIGLFFGYWESKRAANPILAKVLLRNWTFWGGATSLCLLWTAHALMIAYFPTYLYVVHNTSNRAQQNISVIYSFTVAASSLPVALVVRYTRRYKIFTLIGVVLFTAGLGMMIGLSSTSNSNFHLISSQIVIGLGGALTIALIQSAVQVSVPHAFVAQAIAALNIFPCMGNAIGAAVAGAMWSNLLPGHLLRDLASTGHSNEVGSIYAEPLTWIESYPPGTAARTAVVDAYSTVWRIMMIVATAVCAASVVSTMRMANLRLNDFLSVVEENGKMGSGQVNSAKEDKGRLFGDRLFEKLEHALWKSCERCGIKVALANKQGKAGTSTEDDQDREEVFEEKKSDWNRLFLSDSSKSQSAGGGGVGDSSSNNSSGNSNNKNGKARAIEEDELDVPLSSLASLGPTPILVVESIPDEEELVTPPHSAPAGPPSSFFRSPHSVQRSSPLARRFEGESYM